MTSKLGVKPIERGGGGCIPIGGGTFVAIGGYAPAMKGGGGTDDGD